MLDKRDRRRHSEKKQFGNYLSDKKDTRQTGEPRQ